MSLLVSINLSMLAMLAALSLYTNHRLAANEATQNSQFNTQLMHSRLVIEKELMNAGYGISTNVPANIILINDAAAGTVNLRWKYNDRQWNATTDTWDNNVICRGLREETPANENFRQLAIIEATNSNCDLIKPLDHAGLVWNNVSILGRWPTRGALAAHLNLAANNGSYFQFALPGPACSGTPFGPAGTQSNASVTINAPNVVELNLRAVSQATLDNALIVPSTFTVCLPNI